MEAFVLHGPRDLRRESRPEPTPAPGEVLLEVRRAGICGSDIHYYEDFHIGDFVPRAPLVLGHEFSGVIVETAEGTSDFAVGDRVTAEPSIECRRCPHCRSGRYNLCTNLRFIGTAATVPHIDGAFAGRIAVPADHCFRLDDNLDFGMGALVEPIAVGAHAVQRAGPLTGCRILITGGGTIGQMVLAMARASGACDITLADPAVFPREFALDRGASHAIDPSEPDIADSIAAEGGFQVVFEASGAPAALSFAYRCAALGAAESFKSAHCPGAFSFRQTLLCPKSLPFTALCATPMSTRTCSKPYGPAASAKFSDMISAVYPFECMPEAMERARGREGIIKVQIEHSA